MHNWISVLNPSKQQRLIFCFFLVKLNPMTAEFARSNLTLATSLIMSGYSLLEIRANPEDTKQKFFVFKESAALLKSVKEYSVGSLRLDPNEFGFRRAELLRRVKNEEA